MPRIPHFGQATAHTASISDGVGVALEPLEVVQLQRVRRVRAWHCAALDDATGTGAEVVGEALVAERGEDPEQRSFHALRLRARRPVPARGGLGSAGGSVGGAEAPLARTSCPPYQAAMLTAPMP